MKKIWIKFSDKMCDISLEKIIEKIFDYKLIIVLYSVSITSIIKFYNYLDKNTISYFNVICCLLCIGVIWIFVYYLYKKSKNKVNIPINPFVTYKTDKFGDFDWKWNYSFNNTSKQYELCDIIPCCPVCRTDMIIENFNKATCPLCIINKKRHSEFDIPYIEYVEKLIVDKIKKNHNL